MFYWYNVLPITLPYFLVLLVTCTQLVVHFYSSVTVKNGAGGILWSDLSVCEWVSLCVPKTSWTTPCLKKPINGISPNFGHRCIWVHRCANSILGQKVKGQGHSKRRHNRRRQSVEFHRVHSILLCPLLWNRRLLVLCPLFDTSTNGGFLCRSCVIDLEFSLYHESSAVPVSLFYTPLY